MEAGKGGGGGDIGGPPNLDNLTGSEIHNQIRVQDDTIYIFLDGRRTNVPKFEGETGTECDTTTTPEVNNIPEAAAPLKSRVKKAPKKLSEEASSSSSSSKPGLSLFKRDMERARQSQPVPEDFRKYLDAEGGSLMIPEPDETPFYFNVFNNKFEMEPASSDMQPTCFMSPQNNYEFKDGKITINSRNPPTHGLSHTATVSSSGETTTHASLMGPAGISPNHFSHGTGGYTSQDQLSPAGTVLANAIAKSCGTDPARSLTPTYMSRFGGESSRFSSGNEKRPEEKRLKKKGNSSKGQKENVYKVPERQAVDVDELVQFIEGGRSDTTTTPGKKVKQKKEREPRSKSKDKDVLVKSVSLDDDNLASALKPSMEARSASSTSVEKKRERSESVPKVENSRVGHSVSASTRSPAVSPTEFVVPRDPPPHPHGEEYTVVSRKKNKNQKPEKVEPRARDVVVGVKHGRGGRSDKFRNKDRRNDRKTVVGSAPGSEHGSCSDDDSIRSLPAGQCTPKEYPPNIPSSLHYPPLPPPNAKAVKLKDVPGLKEKKPESEPKEVSPVVAKQQQNISSSNSVGAGKSGGRGGVVPQVQSPEPRHPSPVAANEPIPPSRLDNNKAEDSVKSSGVLPISNCKPTVAVTPTPKPVEATPKPPETLVVLRSETLAAHAVNDNNNCVEATAAKANIKKTVGDTAGPPPDSSHAPPPTEVVVPLPIASKGGSGSVDNNPKTIHKTGNSGGSGVEPVIFCGENFKEQPSLSSNDIEFGFGVNQALLDSNSTNEGANCDIEEVVELVQAPLAESPKPKHPSSTGMRNPTQTAYKPMAHSPKPVVKQHQPIEKEGLLGRYPTQQMEPQPIPQYQPLLIQPTMHQVHPGQAPSPHFSPQNAVHYYTSPPPSINIVGHSPIYHQVQQGGNIHQMQGFQNPAHMQNNSVLPLMTGLTAQGLVSPPLPLSLSINPQSYTGSQISHIHHVNLPGMPMNVAGMNSIPLQHGANPYQINQMGLSIPQYSTVVVQHPSQQQQQQQQQHQLQQQQQHTQQQHHMIQQPQHIPYQGNHPYQRVTGSPVTSPGINIHPHQLNQQQMNQMNYNNQSQIQVGRGGIPQLLTQVQMRAPTQAQYVNTPPQYVYKMNNLDGGMIGGGMQQQQQQQQQQTHIHDNRHNSGDNRDNGPRGGRGGRGRGSRGGYNNHNNIDRGRGGGMQSYHHHQQSHHSGGHTSSVSSSGSVGRNTPSEVGSSSRRDSKVSSGSPVVSPPPAGMSESPANCPPPPVPSAAPEPEPVPEAKKEEVEETGWEGAVTVSGSDDIGEMFVPEEVDAVSANAGRLGQQYMDAYADDLNEKVKKGLAKSHRL